MRKLLLTLTVLALGVFPAVSMAHLERPSYWPDPAPDTSVEPAAGGKVPSARSLTSAAQGKGPGKVRVVCSGRKGKESMRRVRNSIRNARTRGFKIRPSQPTIKLSRKQVRDYTRINKQLQKKCRYKSIQHAVNASGNNDRVVIMPGRYTEEASRAKVNNDPKCNPSLIQKDASGSPTPSYAYQVGCPNDQNLIYVQGRDITGSPPATPLSNRQGIPKQELGKCVRCNLQIEGSGPKPTDVIMDGGTKYSGNPDKNPSAKPGGWAKHVVLRVDRGDGFVGRNFTTRGGLEFGFYTEETDGILLEKTKFYWAADYGHLSFTTDHHEIRDCDAFGAGDAALYPGAAPETGSQATSFYPDAPRANTVIRRCDMRGSALGYSGSMGNGVRMTDNHIYGNGAGIATDTLSAAGHPGFPADSTEIDNNYIYSNNLNLYRDNTPVKPLVGTPVGTGIIYAGVNDAKVHDNWIFDNWRDGVMLFAVPDALTSACSGEPQSLQFGPNESCGAEGDIFPGVSCPGAPANQLSTSCNNRFYNNKMGQKPPGFRFPAEVDQFNAFAARSPQSQAKMPNGNDFWWDEFSGNTKNCWFGNTGPDGTFASVTGPGGAGRQPGAAPALLPGCTNGTNPGQSIGLGDPAKTQYLVDCSNGPDKDTSPLACDWWFTPPKPGSPQAARRRAEFSAAATRFDRSAAGRRLQQRISALSKDG